MELNLNGKVALITGSSKGIGKAIAQEFAKEGARVSICARGARDLAAAAEELKQYGAGVIATPTDVSRAEDTQRVIDATVKAFGRIDVLVNNAGDISVGRTLTADVDQWRETMELNLLSAVRFTQGVVPHMRNQGGGRVINVSSVFARTVPIRRVD